MADDDQTPAPRKRGRPRKADVLKPAPAPKPKKAPKVKAEPLPKLGSEVNPQDRRHGVRYVRDPQTGLTAFEEDFCQLLVANSHAMPAYEAYRLAFKANGELKMTTLKSESSELRADPRVQRRIDELIRLRTEIAEQSFECTVKDVLKEIAAIAFSDVGTLFHKDGSMKNPTDMTPAERACIASIEVKSEAYDADKGVTTTVRKINLWNKNDGLEKLAKHLGLYAEDNAQKQASRLADLPRNVRDMILTRLDELAARTAGLAGQPDAGTGGRITH